MPNFALEICFRGLFIATLAWIEPKIEVFENIIIIFTKTYKQTNYLLIIN